MQLSQSLTGKPQANAMIDRVYWTIGNIIQSFKLNKSTKRTHGQAAVMFSVGTTIDMMLQAAFA